MLRLNTSTDMRLRRTSTFSFLLQRGPSRCSAIARFLSLNSATTDHWLQREKHKTQLWYRMPNKHWVIYGDPRANERQAAVSDHREKEHARSSASRV